MDPFELVNRFCLRAGMICAFLRTHFDVISHDTLYATDKMVCCSDVLYLWISIRNREGCDERSQVELIMQERSVLQMFLGPSNFIHPYKEIRY